MDILSTTFKTKWGNKGGIYLITTDELRSYNCCKIGIATKFNNRFKSFKACYGWFDKITILALIDAEDISNRRKIERTILNEFSDYRLQYPDTERDSEWMSINSEYIVKVMAKLAQRKDLNVFYSATQIKRKPKVLRKLPLRVLRRSSKTGKVSVQWEGSDKAVNVEEEALDYVKVDFAPLRESNPLLAKWVSQTEANQIVQEIRKEYEGKPRQLAQDGGLAEISLERITELAKEKQRKTK